jgi:hypothetical protein
MQEHYGLEVASEPNVINELGLVLTGFAINTSRSSTPDKSKKIKVNN